ncbi:MAG: thioredoxin domain-containing protein [Alphaproteobacteria bacterium]|nr:thioredoxin domain-containing protein [Alphaproteobacteria bacterium]
MKRSPLAVAGAAALALALGACNKGGASNAQVSSAPLKQIAAPQGDWTQVVSETPEGGFRMGNPAAPVKLVEYASLSCPFCAAFDRDGVPTLRDKYVKSGQVSWEYRPYMNHPTDPALTVLVRCQGPDAFFGLADQLYQSQTAWYGRVADAPPAQLNAIQNMPPMQRNQALVKLAGLDEFFRQRGMPQSKLDSCLTSQANLDKALEITNRGNKDGIGGTPGFLINGKAQAPDVADWKTLEPLLRSAVG